MNKIKERIMELLSEALPAVNFKSDFLFGELDSFSVFTIMMLLSEEYGVKMDATDATPKNFRSVDSLVKMVEEKLGDRQS